MGKSDPDRRLNRFSTIVELIVNLGQIGSWILGAGAAYVLNIQKFPVVVPGINFTLDPNFQFILIICAMLAYIHFLQGYWGKNKERLSLSESFSDFVFWDLPRLRQPILLIPILFISWVCGQVTLSSFWLMPFVTILVFAVMLTTVMRAQYHLSANRMYEKKIENWTNDDKWMEKWTRRIKAKLLEYGHVSVDDLYESGMVQRDQEDVVEIRWAFRLYFEKYEFDEDLILTRTDQLHMFHPRWDRDSPQWILLTRENLDLRY